VEKILLLTHSLTSTGVQMDPKDSETQRKLKVLAAYIDKQLAAGTHPKTLYDDLINRKVPHQLAVELIEKGIKSSTEQATSSQANRVNKQKERKEKIKSFIQRQLEAGKNNNEVLQQLMEKKVSRDEAISLIKETASELSQSTQSAMSVQDIRPEISPTLPASNPPAALTSINDLQLVATYVTDHLAAGTEQKALVDELVSLGMNRNQAIDLVVDSAEKLKAEAEGPIGENLADKRKSARNKMLVGAALFFGGGCFSLASYAVTEEGGTYWFFYGPIIYGFISGILGLVEWLRSQ
jgi:hypothetical protein